MVRLLLLISILVSVLTAGLGYFNKQKLEMTRHSLASSQRDLAQAQDALAQVRKNGTEAQTQLAETMARLEKTSATLALAHEDSKKTSEKIVELSNQLATKDVQIAALKNENILQENKIKELTPSPTRTNGSQARREAEWTTQLAEQKALVTKLQSQLESARNKIEDYAKKDLERQKLQVRLGLEGKVLAVNRAWNFVVLSIGNKNGITNNAELLVKRGDQLVGKVRITSVEPSSSIADIVSSALSKGQLVQPGDSVIYDTTNDEKE